MAGETRLRARKWQPNVSAMCPSGQIWGSRQGLTAGRRAGKWQPAAHLAPSRGQHGPRGQRIGQLLGEETSSRRCSRHEKMALHEGVWSPHFDGLKSKVASREVLGLPIQEVERKCAPRYLVDCSWSSLRINCPRWLDFDADCTGTRCRSPCCWRQCSAATTISQQEC